MWRHAALSLGRLPFGDSRDNLRAKGTGTGTFIGRPVKIVRDKKTEHLKLEIENFGTFPAKIIGVQQRGKK